MKHVLTTILVATTISAFASPAAAEKYYYKCDRSNVDSVITTTKKPFHDTHWDACGKRFYLTKDKFDSIMRRCGPRPFKWQVTTTGRTFVCGIRW